MAKVALEPLVLPAMAVGPENPFPAFREAAPDRAVRWDASVPEADRARLGVACGQRIVPWRIQDGYTDRRVEQPVPAIVIESDRLRATILPGVGGRVWSLVHRPTGRELLAKNPVLRFANVSLRNAWVAGGIEWNCGQLGHQWQTSSVVFAGELKHAGVRLWEYDRVHGLVWQVDLRAPDGSDFLFATIRVTNLSGRELPMYWWTNIAVPEDPDTRTIVPAYRVLSHDAEGRLALRDLVGFFPDGRDPASPRSHTKAWEGFFHLPDRVRPFVAAVGSDGKGLVETSTPRLRGRKMFAWGMDRTGRWWQDRLGDGKFSYYEIQAGLCRTQLETIPMPAGESWDWTEAFGPLACDPADTHRAVSPGATMQDQLRSSISVAYALEQSLPETDLAARHEEYRLLLDWPVERILHAGSGWGALEAMRRAKEGEPPMPAGTPFPDSTLGPDQEPWRRLLLDGGLPDRDPSGDPGHPVIGPGWNRALDRSLADRPGWIGLLHRGVMRMETLDPAGARADFEASLAMAPSCWALRNLAQCDLRDGQPGAAADRLARAWDLAPEFARLPLARERLDALLAADRSAEALAFAATLPDIIRRRGRIAILEARAAETSGDRSRAMAILRDLDTSELREGDFSVDELRRKLESVD